MVEATNELFIAFKEKVTAIKNTAEFKEFFEKAQEAPIEDMIRDIHSLIKKGQSLPKASQMICQIPPLENNNITDAYKS